MPHIELHVHTKAGSADSSITPDALGRRAAEMETGGLAVTEHFRVWSDWERRAFTARWGVQLYRAIEATTDAGHLVVIGPPAGYSPPFRSADLLAEAARRVAQGEPWFVILAHPFRHYHDRIDGQDIPLFPPDAGLEELAAVPFLGQVDAVEIENGACTDRENALAARVAEAAGLPVTVGSDAHDEREVGRRRLPVSAVPADEHELIELIRSTRSQPTGPRLA